jgi:hypothetical protein
LAAVFLEAHPEENYEVFLIRPDPGFHGGHVFVSDGQIVFDYHGYTEYEAYRSHYFTKIRRFFPLWQGQIIRLDVSPISQSFCRKYSHRLPEQFLHDPRPRAKAYINRFLAATKSHLIVKNPVHLVNPV